MANLSFKLWQPNKELVVKTPTPSPSTSKPLSSKQESNATQTGPRSLKLRFSTGAGNEEAVKSPESRLSKPADISSDTAEHIGPRRGSFVATLPAGFTMPTLIASESLQTNGSGLPSMTKADMQSAFGTNLVPKSGILPSQIYQPIATQDELQTDSDPEFRYKSLVPALTPRTAIEADTRGMDQSPTGTVEVAMDKSSLSNSKAADPSLHDPEAVGRRNKNYTLPDGSIVSGKGLGRGRPGVKRGPRTAGATADAATSPSEMTSSFVAPPLPVHQSTGHKRKRNDSEASTANVQRSISSSMLSSSSRESSIEYNPVATETRSGRKTQRPTTLVSQTSDIASPTVKRHKVESPATNISPATLKFHPKIKRRVYRGREQLALCEHCLRGHGPVGNVIVFCDACNKCWHQRCHDPQVSKEVVSDSKAQWFCADCDRILHGGKKTKKPASQNTTAKTGRISISSAAPSTPQTNVATTKPTFAGPLIGGAGVPSEHKLAYLNTMNKENLIKLIMGASDLAPALPLFQALVPPPMPAPQAQFTSTYITPVTAPSPYDKPRDDDNQDEGYDDHFDEHAALYPKPGNGVKLPPESADLHMLLESRHSRTFSHWVKGNPSREFHGSGNIGVVTA